MPILEDTDSCWSWRASRAIPHRMTSLPYQS